MFSPPKAPSSVGPRKASTQGLEVSPAHYLSLILHRWWLVVGAFILVTVGTMIFTSRLPNIYTSYTTIMVDPQKVPESYVRPTVTGDVRNRLGTLQQQILSATRLQKIIDSLALYPEERKVMVREDVISKMRGDINVSMVSGGGGQDLEAFRIMYSGREPRLVAQVTNQLASLFIEENLRAREQQATGTTEFLQNQLQETRKDLEAQETKLKDYRLKHIGEMPEQQTSDLQMLGQLRSELQIESEALSRAEQQKSLLQSMMAQGGPAPVLELDGEQAAASGSEGPKPTNTQGTPAVAKSPLDAEKARLAALLARGYTDRHPDVQKLKAQIAEQEAAEQRQAKAAPAPAAPPAPVPAPAPAPQATEEPSVPKAPKPRPRVAANYVNPVLQSQLSTAQDEIAKHKQELERLRKSVAVYQAKLEAIPVREQEIADLVRDYEISKAHYTQLLGNQLSAETATQLELRQKGEKFSVLDSAQPAEKPSKPNRFLLNSGGALAGLVLGLLLTLVTELFAMSITSPEQMALATGLPVLEVIPIIRTHTDKVVHKRRIRLAIASGAAVTVVGAVAVLVLYYRGQIF